MITEQEFEEFEREYIHKNPLDGSNTTNQIFMNLEELEIERLVQYRNIILSAFHVVPAHRNEVSFRLFVAIVVYFRCLILFVVVNRYCY